MKRSLATLFVTVLLFMPCSITNAWEETPPLPRRDLIRQLLAADSTGGCNSLLESLSRCIEV
jgi:hypothetical protein